MRARSGVAAAVVAAVVLAPVTAVPLFVVGERFADALDDDNSNGVFALGLVLGVGGPAFLATLVAWRQVRRPVAIALGLAGGALSIAVLFAAFSIYCSAVDCIV
jgi:hypothetical protein